MLLPELHLPFHRPFMITTKHKPGTAALATTIKHFASNSCGNLRLTITKENLLVESNKNLRIVDKNRSLNMGLQSIDWHGNTSFHSNRLCQYFYPTIHSIGVCTKGQSQNGLKLWKLSRVPQLSRVMKLSKLSNMLRIREDMIGLHR